MKGEDPPESITKILIPGSVFVKESEIQPRISSKSVRTAPSGSRAAPAARKP
jgi:hypothetical protein